MAHHRIGKIEDTVSHANHVHQVPGHDEKRHGGKRRFVHTLKNLLRNDVECIGEFTGRKRQYHSCANGHRDRYAQQNQADKTDEQHKSH